MPRLLWKGTIGFGLVQAPVSLYSASRRDDMGFDLLDRRTLGRVGYQRVNKETGEEVAKEDVVKGYQYGDARYRDARYVLLTDEEIRAANARISHTVDVVAFVDAREVPPMFYDSPYYLEPSPGGEKVYALLREALRRSGKIGIAQVVIQTRRHLAAIIPDGPVLVLNTLRWETEVRTFNELRLPKEDPKQAGLGERELAMAGQLIDSMTRHWDPAQYHDTFRADVMALVQRKLEEGRAEQANAPALPPVTERDEAGNVIDLTDMLTRSLTLSSGNAAPRARHPEGSGR